MDPASLMFLIQLFLETQRFLSYSQQLQDEFTDTFLQLLEQDDRLSFEAATNGLVLHHHRLSSAFYLLGSMELGDWVKARSTSWYSSFLMTQYDNQRWIEHFRVTREVIQQLTATLTPLIGKKDTKYRFAIPVGIRVACSLYKLTHAADYLQCSELFAIGKSTVHLVLHEFVLAINIVLKDHIKWPVGNDLQKVMLGFHEFCGLPSVHGAIDVAQIHMLRPKGLGQNAADYYSFKSKGYSIQLQAVVDHEKRFKEVFVGMPGSVNDARVLRVSALYKKALFEGLFEPDLGNLDGVHPYLLGDKGYPLFPWLMVPHKQFAAVQHTVLEALYNKHLTRGRSVVENAFGILKKTFRELSLKTSLDVVFLPDVVFCCCLLYNLILGGRDVDVSELMAQLERESEFLAQVPMRQSANANVGTIEGNSDGNTESNLEEDEISGIEQRQVLERYLGNRRAQVHQAA